MPSRGKPFPVEVRERAVRMVLEAEGDHESQSVAIVSISAKSGMTAETLRKWVRRAEVDAGARPCPTTVDPPLPSGVATLGLLGSPQGSGLARRLRPGAAGAEVDCRPASSNGGT